MRPAYIGLAIAWILVTVVTSYRLMVIAPLIFAVFLVPAVVCLVYGIVAQEPARAGTGENAKTGVSAVPEAPPQAPPAAGPAVQESEDMDSAAAYAKEAVFSSLRRFILMVVATLLLAVPLAGYLVKVLQGDGPDLAVDRWDELVFDGGRALIIPLAYFIPGAFVIAAVKGPAGAALGGALVIAAVFLCPAGLLRFARTGSMTAAFGFPFLVAMIRRIGWLSYTGFLLTCIALGFVMIVFAAVPDLGIVILVSFTALVSVFEARYLAILFDHHRGADGI